MERADRVARRENPCLNLPGARSVIMVGMLYWPGVSGFPPEHHHGLKHRHNNICDGAASHGIVSSYAWGVDYHVELAKRLRELGRHLNDVAGGVGRFYVDTGAILERDFAERAGLGFIGKNSLLINPQVGSGFFIGELFSTIPLPLDNPEDQIQESDDGKVKPQKKLTRGKGKPGCGRCTKCREACPTGAIVEDHVVDARRCISYLTIELKGAIPEGLRRGMGNRVYGCDICQVVCPWNKFQWQESSSDLVEQGYSPLFGRVGKHVTTPNLVELLKCSEEEFNQRFKGTAVKRIGRERMARNAAVALGNVGGSKELAVVESASKDDPSQLVREHARWAQQEIQLRCSRDTDRSA